MRLTDISISKATGKFLLATIAAVALHTAAIAGTFTANGGAGSSKIGSILGDDYISLADAADDFTSSGIAVTGNYTFFIDSSLTETRQIAFGKPTNGFTVTLKPSVGTSPTVVFNYGAQNNNNSNWNQTQGCPGQIIIGLKDLSNTNLAIENGFIKTDKFVIDGSNAVSGTTRDLTLQTSSSAGLVNSRVVHILGSDDCVVKNCNIINACTGSTAFGVFVATVKLPISSSVAPTTISSPLNTLITNNVITATGVNNACGILFNALYDGQVSATNFPSGGGAGGYTVSNNIVTARTRAIAFNLALSGSITGNSVSAGTSGVAYGGVQASGIAHVVPLTTISGWTVNINNNSVTGLTGNGSSGVGGITVGVSTQGAGTFNVFNNMISGLTSTAGDFRVHGIYGRSNASVYNIRHNSINLMATAATGVTSDFVAAILVDSASRSATSTIQNNLIRVAQSPGYGISHVSSVSNLVTDGNDVALVGGSAGFGRLAGTTQATLGAWQTATSQESLGAAVDPATSFGSAWSSASAIDLHFSPNNVIPTGLNGGVPVATTTISTDIDGETRNASSPVRGADEVIGSVASGASDWTSYY